MGLKKYRLGELISVYDERNSDNVYTLDDVKGISIKKEFIETKADMARFSSLASNSQMYASKYLTYMPTEEELRREIEQQKHFFLMQHGKE